MPSLWIAALRQYNFERGAWCIPRKGSEEYAKVRRIMAGEAASPVKKPAEKKETATSPMKAEAPKAKTPAKPPAATPVKTPAKTPAKTPVKAESKAKSLPKDALEKFMLTAPEALTAHQIGVADAQGKMKQGLIAQFVGKIPMDEKRKQMFMDMKDAFNEIADQLYKLHEKSGERSKEELVDFLHEDDKNFRKKFSQKIANSLITLVRNREVDISDDSGYKIANGLRDIANSIFLGLKLHKNIRVSIYKEHVDGGAYYADTIYNVLENFDKLLPGNILSFSADIENDEGYEDEEDPPYTVDVRGRVELVKGFDTISYDDAVKLFKDAQKEANKPVAEARKAAVDNRKGRVAEAGIPQGKKNAKVYTLEEFREAYMKAHPTKTKEYFDKTFKGPKIKAYFARTKLHFENMK